VARADMADGADWTGIPDDDDVWAPPPELPPPLADPPPPLLNTHEMGWEPFERLVLHMARTLDGAHGVRRYGRSGQGQHGLDVVAFFADRAPSVYQAKDWQKFRAVDLENAVEKYSGGRRPFDADRIVVAVASEARDTKTVEKLADLIERHRDIQIELWDRQEISDRLRNQPQLVTIHFGPATAAVFCATASPPLAAQPPASIAADAILRGPIAHLQLMDDLRRAEESVAKRPDKAAELLGAIADRLEAEGFVPHAAPVREQQAWALRAADRRAEEAWVRIDLGWRQLEAGDPFSAGVQVREIAAWGGEAPDDVVRCANALGAATGFRQDHTVTLDQVAEAFDELTDLDPHRVDAALVLAEEAVAARRQDLVEARGERLELIASSTQPNDAGRLNAARLRMCVADCGDGWATLAAAARDAYPPKVTALVMARYARHLALVPQPDASVARWRDAIERACVEGLNDDAAVWLYSLRGVRLQNGLIGNDINDLHRHAQALRGSGNGTLLPEPYRGRERALSCLRDEKWPNALEALRRYLWRSVIGADWAGEIEAHELLGDLFARTGRGYEAVLHYVAAGHRRKLEALCGSARDEPVRFPIDLVTPRPWERAAAFAFVAGCADLLVDEDAQLWCTAAFREIVEHPQPAAFGAPDPWLAAFTAFGKLAVVSTEEQARRFLAISRELLPREPNRYRFTDEDQVHALVGIARVHPALRPEAVDQLLQAVLLDQRMGDLVLREGDDLLRQDPRRTVAAVRDAAAGGSEHAALALIAAEDETTQAVPLARQRLEAAVAPRVHEPGIQTFGTGLSQTAALTMVLPDDDRVRFARGMLDFANDRQETAHNRYDALVALRGIARYIPGDVCDELFGQVVPFAEGQYETPGKGELFPGADDPLQRFRFSFGEASLASAGLMAAAALARSDEQYEIVQRIGVALLRDASDQTANSIAVALASLPPMRVRLPLDILAGHPSPWMRALAAVVWAQRRDEPAEIGVTLAEDPSPHVRRSLATSLRDDPRHAKPREILSSDPRRSVRQHVTEGNTE
jgi:hypothetical protein